MKILLFFVFVFWLIKIARDILFWVYLWQLKEYRRDRMRAHFELQSARQIFVGKAHIGKILLLVSSAFLFGGAWQFFYPIIASSFYIISGTRSVYLAYTKKIREPVFTKKAVLISGLSVVAILALGLFAYLEASAVSLLFSLVILDVLTPILVAGIVGVIKVPSDILKSRIVKKARAKRDAFRDVLVIGVTGSYGKTSMKEYLAHILGEKLRVLKTTENQNSEIGVAKCILDKLSANYDVFIVEIGAYKEGEVKRICDIVRPHIGILTGINEQHVSLFGSLEKTVKAKYELIESLPKNGLAIFNGENDYTFALYEKTKIPKRMYALRSFSVSAKPEITAEKIDFTKSGTRFFVKLGEQRELFETDLLGKHNVLNILGATLAAMALGVTLTEAGKRVKTLKALPHTLEVKRGINGSTIIDDSHSANPRGVMSALDTLDTLRGGKKILVMYPLIELSDKAADIHRRIGVRINKVCDICVLTSTDFAREIKNNAPNTDVFVISNTQLVIQKLTKMIMEGDIVLLENRVPEEIKKAIIARPESASST